MRKKIVKIQTIINHLENEILIVYGNTNDVYIDNISDQNNVNEFSLDWINSTKNEKQKTAEDSIARVILADPSVIYNEKLKENKKVLIIVNNPREVIAKIIYDFFIEKKQAFIHPSAIISEDAKIDPTAYIEAGCVIGKAVIGENTYIKANTVIEDDVYIGNNCVIQAGVVIGADGLGCSRDRDGTLMKFPHLGGVRIGNNVEIGANSQIARGALSDTIIMDGCKINALCAISHNCVIGNNVWISPCSMLAGAVYLEDNVTIFSKVVIRDHIKVGKNSIIGMGSVVTKDVPENEIWLGNPARRYK